MQWEEKRGELSPAEAYRCWLFGEGLEAEEEVLGGEEAASRSLPSEAAPKKRKGFSRERVEEVLKSGGKLTRGELLRCRVRWFSDGVAIGGKSFVEGVFAACRDHFGAKRKDGARKVRQDAGELHALRELRVRAVE